MLAIHQRVQSRIDVARKIIVDYRGPLWLGETGAELGSRLDVVEGRLSMAIMQLAGWIGMGAGGEAQCLATLRSHAVISDINLIIANLQTAIRAGSATAVKAQGGITPELGMVINTAICSIDSLVKTESILVTLAEPVLANSNLCKCGGTFSSFDGEECCSKCMVLRQEIVKPNEWMNAHIPGVVNISSRSILYEKHRRHYRIWIERIQALDPQNFNDSDIQLIRENLQRYRIPVVTLNCTIMREKLKELRLTRYNYTIPLIIKTLGGPAPPVLTIEESDYVDQRFLRVVELFSTAFPEASNTPYYPYFIYKIIEASFPLPHPRRGLLAFIHLQSQETVIKNDNYYQKICEIAHESDRLVYKPTRRST